MLGGAAAAEQNTGKSNLPITGVSRMAPSLSTPATPRTLSRSARMSPKVPARMLPSVPITNTWPAGVSSIAARCALGGSDGLRGGLGRGAGAVGDLGADAAIGELDAERVAGAEAARRQHRLAVLVAHEGEA